MENFESTQSTSKEVINSQSTLRMSEMENSVLSGSFHAEKETLQDLNDRFANYVDAIRKLGDPETQSLTVSGMDVINGSFITDHVETIKEKYEKELQHARDLYENEYAEKMVLNTQISEFKNTNYTIQQELLAEKTNSNRLAEKVEQLKKDVVKRDNDISENKAQLSSLHATVKKLEQEIKDLKSAVDKEKRNVENEIRRAEKNNSKINSLQEHLAFQSKLHKEELAAAYEKVKEIQLHFTKISKPDEENFTYEELLQLREDLLQELSNAKNNVLGGLSLKLNESEDELHISKQKLNEAISAKMKLDELYSQLKIDYDMEKSKSASLESRLNTVIKDYSAQIAALQCTCDTRQKNINTVTEKMHSLMYDYEEIIGDRLALDTELTAYKKLLDSEEKRLNINLTPKKRAFAEHNEEQVVFSPVSGSKLKFLSCDTKSGQYLEIINTGKKQAHLANYKIQRKFLSNSTIEEFKILQKIIIPHEETFKIYASNHEIGKDELAICVPSIQSWICKGELFISLMDTKDQVVAEASITFIPSDPSETSPTTKRRTLQFSRLNRSKSELSSSFSKKISFGKDDGFLFNKITTDDKSSAKSQPNKGCAIF